MKPRRQSGCVSNASSLSLRFVVPCTALWPSPRRADETQTGHASRSAMPRRETPGEGVRRRDDGAARDYEAGEAPLQLHALDHVLDGAVVAAAVPVAVHVRVEAV